MPEKILLVDDEQELLAVLKRSLGRQGYVVDTASTGQEAWKALSETAYDLVVSDLAMEPMSGLELLKQIRTIDHIQPFIIMTGAGTIETAVEAIKLGAYHYITKPFKTQELALLARRAIEYGRLHRKLETFSEREQQADSGAMVIGNNALMQQMMTMVEKVSDSDVSILIQGETGTGKSLFARRIHNASSRADKPFFTIDCGALSENLLESELFGHVKGAFTGAIRAKRGLLEEAQGGTIFLDEIGELTPSTQVKLLRAIQEKEIKPVGGNTPITVDVRFLSATSRNLEEAVEAGEFRKDLYYRLAVIPLHLPALRNRQEDMVLFVGHFVHKFNVRYNKKVQSLTPGAMQTLRDSPWKGNIRELENVIERAVLLAEGQTISVEDLCAHPICFPETEGGEEGAVSLKQAVKNAEIKAIRQALAAAEGNRSKAAKILGIGRRTLYDKIESYDI
ncbi:two component, sigma54 specific, transcriptional regulator, Fis family [Pseudodesulfovibrio mercurii]|uniref:Two component, sigma54 specific, transcriptional regulator, Fis family n=1 Tax=Pseudodesulfovibrio mercurii TaxID=641491 RepID=F0JDN5_9BACT|nr:sigma-54 dependent transcriptional regulator [Pseudodesulfovibrio mercurii]EGB14567.1 two component, sigma54 specific, transcriptional regulator, Fis family [Pseudodesulfovibrio mercurii]